MTILARRDQPDHLATRVPLHQEWRSHESEDALSVRRIVRKLLRRKRLVLVVLLIVLIPATIATFLTTPLYRSAALVQVNPDSVQVMPYRDVADVPISGGSIDNYMGTQDEVLRGAGLRARVARRLEEDFKGQPIADEAARLEDRFEAKIIERSQLFELTYLAPSPQAAATVVNLYSEEYVKQNFEMRQATRVKAEQDLKKELEGLEGRLQFSETELVSYATSNEIFNLAQGQVDPGQQRLSFLTQQFVEAEAQLAISKSSLEAARNASVADFPQRMVTEQVGTLDGRLLTLEQELSTLRSSFGENWPEVVEKRNELALVREQLVREKAAVLDRSVEQARLDIQGAEARRSLAAQALAEQKATTGQFHSASIQYNILKREVDTNRNLYDGLLERLRQTGVMAGFQFGNIQIIEAGRPQPKPDTPNVPMNLALAAVLGLALGLCLVVLMDFWDTTISTVEEAAQFAPLPSLGSVPLMKLVASSQALLSAGTNGKPATPGLSRFIGLPGWLGAREVSLPRAAQNEPLPFEVTESIRSICASILLSRSDARPRVIVVTSATHSEGKTTIVTHLGKAFADAGLSTLLVEADLRKPDLSRAFGIGNEDGLSLYLAGHVSPWPKIHQTEVPNLFLTAGGPVPPNPAALLHSEKLGAFLKAAAADYQIVILDAPPLLPIADARILGMQADGVVLVIRAGQTAKNLVGRAWAMLESSGANTLGMVLNGWEPERAEAPHYSYYPHA